MKETVYLLLGSNIGDREQNLYSAVSKLEHLEGLEIIAISGIYLSEPMGVKGHQPTFMNQVVKAEYSFTPSELLHALERIEIELGRTDKGKKLPRTIDLDILLFGERVINQPDLVIPHSQLLKRPFALIPLLEIDPTHVHPVTKKELNVYITEKDKELVILFKDHVARNV
jgi:2-amino-4-hydroxy-6-hydroxymethyldihydropteridine diphosphokinase